MPENFPVVDGPVVVRHRHPWTTEEKVILAFLLLIPVILFTVHLITSVFNAVLLIGVTAVALVGAAGLYYLGLTRKKSSELIATLEGTTLKVVGNKLPESNRIDLLAVQSVRSELVGINPTFFLSSEDKTLRVPLRVAKKSPVSEALLSTFESVKMDKSAQKLALELEK